MTRFGAILIFAGAVLVSTHILAPAAPPPPQPAILAADLAAVAQARPVVDEVDSQVDRLRERLASPPAYPPPTRNPFRFGDRKTEPPRPRAAAPAAAVTVEREPAPALPRLVAIATNVVGGALVRTAVLANGDDVVVVKAGESLGTFTVRTIGVDTVELADPATGRTFKISLQ